MIHIDGNNLSDLFDRYYRPRRLLGCAESTSKQYHIQFRHFGRFLGHSPTLSDLDDDTLAAFLDWFSRGLDRGGKARSPETANKARSHLTALWRFAAQTGRVERWPTIAELPCPETPRLAWDVSELAAIFRAASETTGFVARIPAGLYWESLHEWWMCGGERTFATLAVRWEWVDLQRAVAVVPGTVRKTKAMLSYALSPRLVDLLREIVKPTRELVWPWPHRRDTFYATYRDIIRRAGLPTAGAGPQKMRRSFASHLHAAGGDATKALHHSTRSVTITHYIDPRIAGPEPYWQQMPKFRE